MKTAIRCLTVHSSVLIVAIGFSGTALSQQFVTDTSFCTLVANNECIDALPSGATVDLSELKTDKNGPILYFWGRLRNPSESVVAFYFSREGDCYPKGTSIPKDKARAANNIFVSSWRFITSLTFGDLISRIFSDTKGEVSAKAAPVDAKVTFAVTKPSENFRVSSFRNVLCGGRVEARLLDSQASPIPPDANNDFKFLTITNSSRKVVASQ